MEGSSYLRNSLAVLAIILMMAGCATSRNDIDGSASKLGEPGWVAEGSGAFVDLAGNEVFFGVGVSSNMKNEALLYQTADDRAKGEAAKVAESFVHAVIEDYRKVRPDADIVRMERDMTNVTSMFLTSVQIMRHWMNPVTGAVYSLARLYLYRFKDDLGEVRELDGAAEKHMRDNASRVHAQMIKKPVWNQSPQTTTK